MSMTFNYITQSLVVLAGFEQGEVKQEVILGLS